jgi:hypothetical protein
VPSTSDRTITLQVADGTSHEARLKTLDSVRSASSRSGTSSAPSPRRGSPTSRHCSAAPS